MSNAVARQLVLADADVEVADLPELEVEVDSPVTLLTPRCISSVASGSTFGSSRRRLAVAARSLADRSESAWQRSVNGPPRPGSPRAPSRTVSFSARAAPSGASTHEYRPRDPTTGPLHQLLRESLSSYFASREARPPPAFVAKALRGYLRCGVLVHGFARFRCDDCAQSRLVALSCKQRAFCPRCIGRRMADQARHLVQHVLPPVRTRQWVLSFPHELRWHMAFDHDLTLAVWRVARRAIDAFYKARARRVGPPGHNDDAQSGSIMAIQRFGGALNLNVHFHAVYLDGAFVERSDGTLRFLEALPPTASELEALVADIKARVTRLVQQRGLAEPENDHARTLLLPGMGELYSDGVLNRGAWRVRTHDPRGPNAFMRRKAHEEGFDLDAHVTVRPGARAELERLVRYILRPPLKEERLTLHADSVVLELKTPWRDGTTHIRMSRARFIDRLAALVPPPAANTLLYGGILAANARLRPHAVSYQRPIVTVTKRARKTAS
ncbi:MAG: transposase, partial [Myxococcales bacterium]|nr:transposase [Myxococcales bacterium]